MTSNFKSEENILNLTTKFMRVFGFQSDGKTFDKCKNLVTNMLNEITEEESKETIDQINENILNKCQEKYKNGINYLNNLAKNNEFFDDKNITKLVDQFIKILNL